MLPDSGGGVCGLLSTGRMDVGMRFGLETGGIGVGLNPGPGAKDFDGIGCIAGGMGCIAGGMGCMEGGICCIAGMGCMEGGIRCIGGIGCMEGIVCKLGGLAVPGGMTSYKKMQNVKH